MKKTIFLLTLSCYMPIFANGQVHHYTGTDSINAPYLHITTVNGEIPSCESYTCPPPDCWGACVATNPNKVKSRLVITQLGDTLYDSGEYEKKTSGLTVKLRGNNASAEKTLKKSYKLKLEKKANLIPVSDSSDQTNYKDKEWILLNNLGRNYNQLIGCHVAQLVGMPWVPRCIPVQVELNGDYQGFFYLSEAVSQNNDCRIALGDGGYIVELDPYWWIEDKYFMGPFYSRKEMRWTYKEPDTDDLTADWGNVIQYQVSQFEQHISQKDAASYINFESVAKWLLAQDILGNHDGAGSNVYFCGKDTINPFPMMLPLLWDFDENFLVEKDKHSCSHDINIFRSLLQNSEFQLDYKMLFNAQFNEIINQTIAYIDSLETSQYVDIFDSLAHYENERWFNGEENMKPFNCQMAHVKNYLQERAKRLSINSLFANGDDTNFYNILGQRVSPTSRGVIILNKGKKILILPH